MVKDKAFEEVLVDVDGSNDYPGKMVWSAWPCGVSKQYFDPCMCVGRRLTGLISTTTGMQSICKRLPPFSAVTA